MDIVDIYEMAEILGVNDRTLRAMARNGEVPHLKVGVLYRFEKERVIEHFRVERKAEGAEITD